MVTDWKKNLNDIFEIDTEVVAFKTPEECIEKVKWLLNNPTEREKISRAGQRRVVERTTATARETSAHEPVWSSVRSDNKRPSSPSSSTCTFPPTLDIVCPMPIRSRGAVSFAPTSAISPKRSRTSGGEVGRRRPHPKLAGPATAQAKLKSSSSRPRAGHPDTERTRLSSGALGSRETISS